MHSSGPVEPESMSEQFNNRRWDSTAAADRSCGFNNFAEDGLAQSPQQDDSLNAVQATSTHPVRRRASSNVDQAVVEQALNQAHYQLNSGNSASILQHASPSHASGLHISTDLPTPPIVEHGVEGETLPRRSLSNAPLPRRMPSFRNMLHTSAGVPSPGSTVSSPQLTAMGDMTPLPSPIGGGRDPWRIAMRSRSRASSTASNKESMASSTTASTSISSPPRRKAYNGLRHQATESTQPIHDVVHESRSVSEYMPIAFTTPKPRHVAVSGSGPPIEASPQPALHREQYLADQRGLLPREGQAQMDLTVVGGEHHGDGVEMPEHMSKRLKTDIYTATSVATGVLRKYRSIRFLGKGTFSRVFLALQQADSIDDGIDYSVEGTDFEGVKKRSKRFVAVKVIEHGPAGGADEERIGISLKREVEILKSINHPSVVHLRAFGEDDHRALLVLNFCPGGDLFELASTKLDLMIPTLVQRIFAELVSAVRYLHENYIVHRDIKLENVLLNVPWQVLSEVSDWQRHDRAIVTLTDLGLSRRIPEPPESPLLTTRCGSEDYAAPEILMGQPYDGRQTDAWALGVVLYALMEGRLPFDPLPGTKGDPAKLRARTPHRIARCEWAWYKYGDEDGDWDTEKGKEYEGAQVCVDLLLKRTSRRKELEQIGEMSWVKSGILVQGGLEREEEAT